MFIFGLLGGENPGLEIVVFENADELLKCMIVLGFIGWDGKKID